MPHPHLLHIVSATKYVSPFDINMAYEAKFDAVIPYCNVAPDEVHGLVQDTVVSRSPAGRAPHRHLHRRARVRSRAGHARSRQASHGAAVRGVGDGRSERCHHHRGGDGRTGRALAIGDVKFKVHTALLERMYSADAAVFLAHEEAYACARDIVARV